MLIIKTPLVKGLLQCMSAYNLFMNEYVGVFKVLTLLLFTLWYDWNWQYLKK